jgi:hypothetical protein
MCVEPLICFADQLTVEPLLPASRFVSCHQENRFALSCSLTTLYHLLACLSAQHTAIYPAFGDFFRMVFLDFDLGPFTRCIKHANAIVWVDLAQDQERTRS